MNLLEHNDEVAHKLLSDFFVHMVLNQQECEALVYHRGKFVPALCEAKKQFEKELKAHCPDDLNPVSAALLEDREDSLSDFVGGFFEIVRFLFPYVGQKSESCNSVS